MTKVEITKKDGTRIVIEGSEKEVKHIIDYVSTQTIPSKHSKDQNISAERKLKRSSGSALSISDQIDELKEDGFFDGPKGLADVKKALAERGMIYSITTLSGKLIEKVRKRDLGRIKENKKWMYVKR